MVTEKQLKIIGFKSFTQCQGKHCTEMGCYYNPRDEISFCENCLEKEITDENSEYFIEPSEDDKRQHKIDLAMNEREGK